MLEELKKEGRIRYYGFSNYRTERLKEIAQCLRERNLSGITAVSNQWSLAGINPGGNTNPDPTLVEFSREEYQWHCETGAAAVPFSSTAMGFFSKLTSLIFFPFSQEIIKLFQISLLGFPFSFL